MASHREAIFLSSCKTIALSRDSKRWFYKKTEVFVIDEVNAMATSQLWLLDETVCKVFHPKQRLKDENVKIMSFGELKMVFLGDAVQLTLVCGAPIYNITVTRIETNSGCHNSSEYKCKTARGFVLYSNYLSKNCISLTKSYRNQGLLLDIMDHVQNAFQTLSDLHSEP